MAESLSLKLLIDTKGKRVLFAEVGKDFVDFLFCLLALPVGTAASLLKQQQMAGSLANLYGSLENLNDSYIQPNKTKDTFLNPVVDSPIPLLPAPPTLRKKVYFCSCARYYSDVSGASCPGCNRTITSSPSYVAPPAAKQSGDDKGGVVRGMVTYMVMDDLVVTPLSTIKSITLLSKFSIKDVSVLEEKVVHFGVDEAVKLLNATLQSTGVLTDVFLKGIQIKGEEPK